MHTSVNAYTEIFAKLECPRGAANLNMVSFWSCLLKFHYGNEKKYDGTLNAPKCCHSQNVHEYFTNNAWKYLKIPKSLMKIQNNSTVLYVGRSLACIEVIGVVSARQFWAEHCECSEISLSQVSHVIIIYRPRRGTCPRRSRWRPRTLARSRPGI